MHSSFTVLAVGLLVSLSQTIFAQIKSDTLSMDIVKVYEENTCGKIIEKTIIDYKIKTSEVTDTGLDIPAVIVHDSLMRIRAVRMMNNPKAEDTILVFKQNVATPMYYIWKAPEQICDKYRWKMKKWSLEKDQIISVIPTFEERFWIWFIMSLIVLPFVGWVLLYGFYKEKEPLVAHIIFQMFVGWATVYFYFMNEKNIPSYFFSGSWLKLAIVNYIAVLVGGHVLYRLVHSGKKIVFKKSQNV